MNMVYCWLASSILSIVSTGAFSSHAPRKKCSETDSGKGPVAVSFYSHVR
ncbi:MAG: hypothetical protein ACJ0IB_03365 [Verrucomicrobiales bacterium]